MSKMSGMTVQERLNDISKRSGLSVEICRRVLNAESESIIESLKRGERATMSGRVTLRPEMRQKMLVGQKVENFVKVKAEVSSTLEAALCNIKEFKKDEEEAEEPEVGVRLHQLTSLM